MMQLTPAIAQRPVPAAHTRAIPAVAVIALAVATYCVLAFFRLGSFDLATDEGRFGLSGANILLDYHQLATVSEGPLGKAGTKPYFYPLTLAMSIAFLGHTEVAVRSVNGIVLLVAAFLLYGAARLLLRDHTAALLAFVFFLLNPGTITYARAALPEPLTVCCGCAALWATARWNERRQLAWAAFSGVMLGLGFVTKIWLVLPFVLACGTVYLVAFWRKKDGLTILSAAVWLASLATVSASHILLVVLLTPTDLAHWVNLYSGISLNSRFAGAGYDPDMWYRPWWFYPAAAFKATFFGLPLLLLGCVAVARRRDAGLALLIIALVTPLALFSIMRVKQASYIFPVLPGLMMLIALGCLRLFQCPGRGEIALAFLTSAAAALFFFTRGVFGTRELAAMAGIYFVFLAAAFMPARRLRLVRGTVLAAALGAMLLADVVAVKGTLQHRTGFREIASFFRSQLEHDDAREVSFIAPEFPSMEFYTFRRGEYWQTFYFHKSDDAFLSDLKSGAQIFYVVDRSGALYGGKISPERLAALAMHAKDVTPEIEKYAGRPLPVQVFVPAARASVPALVKETRE
ncbi:MAG: glycosyltransferase family 39 protein [Acidobacteriia bacterium]|nr:glycosyltransferase family 39 protein [Terriglobia bacterium]